MLAKEANQVYLETKENILESLTKEDKEVIEAIATAIDQRAQQGSFDLNVTMENTDSKSLIRPANYLRARGYRVQLMADQREMTEDEKSKYDKEQKRKKKDGEDLEYPKVSQFHIIVSWLPVWA